MLYFQQKINEAEFASNDLIIDPGFTNKTITNYENAENGNCFNY
jgi:hypothetical protein